MNLLNDCSETEDDGQQVAGRKQVMSRRLASLRHCTVLAMSNLLNANVDSGLMHSIGERSIVLSPLHHCYSWCKKDSCLFRCLCVNCNYLRDVFPL